jgi:hypothetical protein
MIFGFLLTALYWPGIAGAATTPRWGLLAVALPVVLWYNSAFRGGMKAHADGLCGLRAETNRGPSGFCRVAIGPRFTFIHLFGALYLTWSAISLSWTPNKLDGIGELIKLVILAQAFVLGARITNLIAVLRGMALGLLVSSIIILVQLYAPDIVLHTTTHSGLFINSGSLAEIAALVLIGLVYEHRSHIGNHDWFGTRHIARIVLLLALFPCIILPQSRGAWLALVTAFTIWLWSKSKTSALALMGLTAILITYSLHLGFHTSSVIQRLGMYADAISGLTWLGHGIGSFWTDYAPLSNTLDIFVERPEHLHNDWLEIVFELGPVGAIIVCGILRAAGMGKLSTATVVLSGFIAESAVGFTLHNPCTAFLAALCLGHLARRRHSLRYLFHVRRIQFRAWLERQRLEKHGITSSRECEVVSIGS